MSNAEYKTISGIVGPLLVVERTRDVSYGEVARIRDSQGMEKTGQVLDVSTSSAIIQVFEGTFGLDTQNTSVRFLGETLKMGVSREMLGRTFNGLGKPIDNHPEPIPEERDDINGCPINPHSREHPRDFIQTGISSIDCMNTLVRGQKLPIFSAAGLPHNELAAQIARQAQVLGDENEFAVVLDRKSVV